MYSTGCEAQAFGGMIVLLAGFFFMLIVLGLLFGLSKSRRYRKLITDLYVAGKIKQISKKEGIDLAQEMKDFRSVVKKWRMETQPLDNTIEEELQEKVTEGSKESSK